MRLTIHRGSAALRSALAHLDRLPAETYLSLNASPLTAVSPFLKRLLADVGERIVVEITEHAPVGDYDALRGLVHLRREPREALLVLPRGDVLKKPPVRPKVAGQ